MPLEPQVVSAKPVSHPCDLLAVLVREGAVSSGKISDAHLGDLDRALGGLLSTVAVQEEFTGKEGQQLALHTHGKAAAQRLLVLGLGKHADADRARDALRTAASRAVKAARPAGARTLALVWPQGNAARSGKAEESGDLERDVRAARRGGEAKTRAGLSAAAHLGARLAEATCLARDLVNEPAGRVTPGELASTAREVARERGLQIEVLGLPQIRKLKMNLFLGVAQGSAEEPRLVRLSYLPRGKRAGKPVALVGKAITFDSGGLSLKTAQGMEDMKTDMAGAAAVIAAMSLVPEIAPLFPVHGYFGACENLPSGTAYKPGDVLVGRNGVSVEVLNTDAEGRLVLGDVLAWAAEAEPAAIVDLATLTGAILVALGPWTAGLFSNDEGLAGEVQAAARAAGESVWRMPLRRLDQCGAVPAAFRRQDAVGAPRHRRAELAGQGKGLQPSGRDGSWRAPRRRMAEEAGHARLVSTAAAAAAARIAFCTE